MSGRARVDLNELLRSMPKRKIKRTTIDLPEDQIKVIDACAKAIGVSRSNFLTWWFDSSVKAMIDWTTNMLNRSDVEIVGFKEEEVKTE